MNTGEYGVLFYLGTSFNLSAFSTLSLAFVKPDLTTLTVTNPAVSISASPVVTAEGTFAGNTYAIYSFANGDVNQPGTWTVRLTYTDPSQRLISAAGASFVIGP